MGSRRKRTAAPQGRKRKVVVSADPASGTGKARCGARRLAGRKLPGDAPAAAGLATLEEMESEHIRRVLVHVADNKTRAARILGINRVSLWRKIRNMKIPASLPPAVPGGSQAGTQRTAPADR